MTTEGELVVVFVKFCFSQSFLLVDESFGVHENGCYCCCEVGYVIDSDTAEEVYRGDEEKEGDCCCCCVCNAS